MYDIIRCTLLYVINYIRYCYCYFLAVKLCKSGEFFGNVADINLKLDRWSLLCLFGCLKDER